MNFNNKNPFEHVYKEVFYKLYDKHLFDTGKKRYLPVDPHYMPSIIQPEEDSIESILNNEGEKLFDKTKNTANAILSRLDINDYINNSLDYTSLNIGNEILELQRMFPPVYSGKSFPERRVSTLFSMQLDVEKQRLSERVACWQDLLKPMSYFTEIWHQHKDLKHDQKLLDEK